MVDSINSWANAITATRILLSPLVFLAIPEDGTGSWWAFVLWFVLCASDGVDGYIARRRGPTAVGAFLDPLADKVLVLGAMFTLVAHDVFWFVPVAVIAGRELLISVYRILKSGRGVSVPASKLGKYKTVVQQFAVAFAIMPLTALDATWTWLSLLWIAVVLTIVSGAQYLWYAGRPADVLVSEPA
ncbi:MAG: CDP-diacylglycerol--glycerol-3-phosphate 3-phosphatidyltransferase [Ilumatobacter sp.]|uniref:CDP-diacylglycerol--glycerol-3-phosphate 3-phosphatidyltransferase n=1 Tax=Ilumatobacter sp. TaxID=1967498 RepID=UPI00391B1391